jgi:hypothetical protein
LYQYCEARHTQHWHFQLFWILNFVQLQQQLELNTTQTPTTLLTSHIKGTLFTFEIHIWRNKEKMLWPCIACCLLLLWKKISVHCGATKNNFANKLVKYTLIFVREVSFASPPWNKVAQSWKLSMVETGEKMSTCGVAKDSWDCSNKLPSIVFRVASK